MSISKSLSVLSIMICFVSQVSYANNNFPENISSKNAINKKLIKSNIDNSIKVKPSLEQTINESKSLPDSRLWWLLVITLGSLIFNIYQFRHSNKQKRSDIVDEYWVRNIALPICIKPLVDFIEESAEKFQKMEEMDKSVTSKYDESLDNFHNEFCNQKSKIIKKSFVLNTQWGDIYTILTSKLDLLEDNVTMHCFINNSTRSVPAKKISKHTIREDMFYSTLGDILSELSMLHTSIIK